MSVLILALAVAALLVMEKFYAPWILKKLNVKLDCDCEMAEPDQKIFWNAAVENQSRLPVPFVRLRQTFPEQTSFHGQQQWQDAHCQKGIQQWHEEEIMALYPRQSCTRSFQVSFPTRGEYFLGNYVLSTGDLLGFRETRKTGDGKRIVVIPRRSENKKSLEAVGGFLGDLSVRRFILEDPILTVGFRDYTGREPMKAISWTRTAVAGSMQVKQYDYTAEQHVMILLNVEGGSANSLEECFRLMRTVCEELERKKIPFGLRTNGNLPGPVGNLFWMAEGLGGRHLNTILYSLGMADGTCFHSFRYLVSQTLRYRKNDESYIVIAPKESEELLGLIRQLEAHSGNRILTLYGEVKQP